MATVSNATLSSYSNTNVRALEGSVFKAVSNNAKGAVRKYVYEDGKEASLDSAVSVVQRFLKDNPNLCPMFPFSFEELKQEIKQKKYLVINKDAVCLASERLLSPEALPFKDACFSEGMLKNPIQCSQGHFLEKELAERWVAKKGDICPGPGEKHSIGDLEVNEDFRDMINEFKAGKEKEQKRLDKLENFERRNTELENQFNETKSQLEEANKQLNRQTIELNNLKADIERKNREETAAAERADLVSRIEEVDGSALQELSDDHKKEIAKVQLNHSRKYLTGNKVTAGLKITAKGVLIAAKITTKIIEKTTEKAAEKAAEKVAEKGFEKAAKKLAGKAIPCVSVGFGFVNGVRRWQNDEKGKAIIEVANGFVPFIPFVGPAFSIIVDGALLCHDMHEMKKTEAAQNTTKTVTLEQACTIFKIDLKETPILTKDLVDARYRENVKLLHPDKANAQVGEYFGEACEKILTNYLNRARDVLNENVKK